MYFKGGLNLKMKKKIFVVPKSKSYIDSVQPHIYYPKEIENAGIALIRDLFRDNALVFEIINDKYYPLTYQNYEQESTNIEKNEKYSFTKTEIDNIINGDYKNYVPEVIVDDELEEIVKVAKLTLSGSITGETSSPISAEVVLKLENDTFNTVSQNDDVKSWFNDSSLGTLLANVKSEPEESNTKLTITISGTTTDVINKQTKVTIPSEKLTSSKELQSTNEISINITQHVEEEENMEETLQAVLNEDAEKENIAKQVQEVNEENKEQKQSTNTNQRRKK